MRPVRIPSRAGHRRRGLTTPVVAVALLITMLGLAVILDRIWLDAAQVELTAAAEASALAAARQLAHDDRLMPVPDPAGRLSAARQAAEDLAEWNLVAGKLPSIKDSRSDILFGNYTAPDSEAGVEFDTQAADPLTVRITMHRTRERNNPVALFVGQATGVPFGDVVRQADATLCNRIDAVRPVSGSTIPALPIAIWQRDPTGNRRDTWAVQIEQRQGTDRYRFDEDSQRPVSGSDGIPEITVRSLARGGRAETCNIQVLDLGSSFHDDELGRQFRTGLTAEDLLDFGGQLPASGSLSVPSSAKLTGGDRDALEDLLGQPRICLLYSATSPGARTTLGTTTCTQLVAVRVMSLRDESDGSCQLVLQPTVLATRTAVVSVRVGQTAPAAENKYIYNLKLTN